MKFMKLGSKPDSFQTDGNNVRFVATELASDITVNVGDVMFYLHKDIDFGMETLVWVPNYYWNKNTIYFGTPPWIEYENTFVRHPMGYLALSFPHPEEIIKLPKKLRTLSVVIVDSEPNGTAVIGKCLVTSIIPYQQYFFESIGWILQTMFVDESTHYKKFIFPLLSKSARLQKLVATSNEENNAEINIHDMPGGPAAFEICAKFCYGMTVTLNAYNVVAARCAAEYLEMHETVEKGNLIYKIEVFLNSSIFCSWKDSIIVLQTTKSLIPWCEELKVINRCIDSIASKASIDTSRVEWSYTYNRKKLPSENRTDPQWNGVRKQQMVPKDWWVEDLSELELDFYKRVIMTIKTKGRTNGEVIGEALKAYASRRLPGFSKGVIQGGDTVKNRSLVDTIIWLLPTEKRSVSCGFLLKLLKLAILLDTGETGKRELVRKIGLKLEEASVPDLLVPAPAGETMMYDVDVVHSIVEEFVMQEQSGPPPTEELQEIRSPGFITDASKLAVVKLIDGYLAEIARDPNLPLLKFMNLAQMVSGFSRPSHDGLYRAIDMFLKEHPGTSKSERKKICRLMDCKKLSVDACAHAVQNERLPLRVVVQVLFFEQARAATAATGNATPDLPGNLRALLPRENGGSHGSSRSTTTNTEEDWDSVPTTEELKALKGELASLRLGNGGGNEKNSVVDDKNSIDKAAATKVKGLLMSKRLFSKIFSSKGAHDSNSSSDTSESPGSINPEEGKSTPSRNRRKSLS